MKTNYILIIVIKILIIQMPTYGMRIGRPHSNTMPAIEISPPPSTKQDKGEQELKLFGKMLEATKAGDIDKVTSILKYLQNMQPNLASFFVDRAFYNAMRANHKELVENLYIKLMAFKEQDLRFSKIYYSTKMKDFIK